MFTSSHATIYAAISLFFFSILIWCTKNCKSQNSRETSLLSLLFSIANMRGLLLCILGVVVLASANHTEPAKYKISPSLMKIFRKFCPGFRTFTTNLYKCLSKHTQGDLVLSPLSTHQTLALVLAGAKGPTYSEIRKALNYNLNGTESKKLWIALSKKLNCQRGSYKSLAASGIFVDDDFPVREQFKAIAENHYRTKVETVNFAKVNQSVTAINAWVKERIPKIESILAPNHVSKTTKLVLINALQISAKWQTPFPTEKTKTGVFHVSGGKTKNVNYMHCCREVLYAYDDVLCAKFLELPFADVNKSLVIVLPIKKNGLSELEAKLDKVMAFNDLGNELVNISLPRFNFNTLMHLKPILQKLGIKRIFNRNLAELTGISKKKGLFVNNLVQKGCIHVNEAGLDAVAGGAANATTAVTNTTKESLELTFNAEHPFLFYVKIAPGTPLFIGRVVNPETAKPVVNKRIIEEDENDNDNDDENDDDDYE